MKMGLEAKNAKHAYLNATLVTWPAGRRQVRGLIVHTESGRIIRSMYGHDSGNES